MPIYIFVQLCFLVSQNRSSAAGGRRTKILQRRRHRRRMGCNAAAEKRPQSPSPSMSFLLGREREVESICTHPRIHYNPIYYAVSHSPASSAELSHFRWRGRKDYISHLLLSEIWVGLSLSFTQNISKLIEAALPTTFSYMFLLVPSPLACLLAIFLPER